MFNKIVLVASVIVVGSMASADRYKDHQAGHPRQNEVNHRLDNQTNRANRQEQNGKITQGQANQMKRQDQKIYNQEQADKAKNGGDYLTKGQQNQINHEENQVNREDRRDMRKDGTGGYGGDHPRQAEVNGRDNHQINRDNQQAVDGKITNAQAQKLDNQDKAIYNEEQNMKAKNGGDYLTKQQQAKLNRQENRVNREDKRDERQDAANGGNGAPPPPADAGGNPPAAGN